MIDNQTAGDLAEIYVRGVVAKMFTTRGIVPTELAWKYLRGEEEITARVLGEIAFSLGFELDVEFREIRPLDEENSDD
jgi:hypothetical protein